MWINKEEISEWAFGQCKNGNDTEEIRDLITEEIDIYNYCKHIRNIEEMWSKIVDPFWIYMYCTCVPIEEGEGKGKRDIRK